MSEIKKLGMLAGSGMMPVEIIKYCKQKGIDLFVVGLEPFANEDVFADLPHTMAKLGEAGKIVKALKGYGVQYVVMAGGIKRPSLKELIPDWEGMKIMGKLAIKKMGDDSMFRAIIHEFESRGFKIVGIEDVIPEMLFTEGIYGKVKPSDDDMDDIKRGIEVAKALGSVDVGQAVVVQEGMVLAVEAVEGTDNMLSRASMLKKSGKAPVMVKIKKPGQEVRTDMPAIGLQSIEQLKKYGMKGIAVESGGILLIEKEEVIKMADESGIFIIGMNID
ncbi:MAG: UDP-2,3-diacylglucosamine diphosphatase LpxI [Bacteroidales bacterium]|jgi:DUF1009 family protein|nr:UDP-2,3-diacylglucosamine diphosphatase LpxI [Bacteroidales bacterium]